PSNEAIRSKLTFLGFTGCKILFLHANHVLIKVDDPNTSTKLWLKCEISILNFPMRIFKWSADFDLKKEPPIVPALRTIANIFGTLLKVDDAALKKTRLQYARFCVALNLESSHPTSIVVSCGNKRVELSVEVERLPNYCSYCSHVGHDDSTCYIKNSTIRPAKINKGKNPDIEPSPHISPPSFALPSSASPSLAPDPTPSDLKPSNDKAPPNLSLLGPVPSPDQIPGPSTFLEAGPRNVPDSLEPGSPKPNSMTVESCSSDSDPDSPNHSHHFFEFEDDFTVAPNMRKKPIISDPSPSALPHSPQIYTNSSGKK
ncbi:zinc ion binding, partial [Striga asiatica]